MKIILMTKMRIISLILMINLISVASQYKRKQKITCNGLIFDDVYYDKKLLFKGLGKPTNLMMHKFSGTLFFSQTVGEDDNIDFVINACDLAKQVCRRVPGISGGYAIGYDSGNDDVYFGGHDGIYTYNFADKKAQMFGAKGTSIWEIFIRRKFYYIEYPTQKLHIYDGSAEKFVPVAEASKIEIDHFFLAKNFDVYFSNKTALFKVVKLFNMAASLSEDIVVRQIADDAYGDVYFLASDGIYMEDKSMYNVKIVANIDDAYGLTFDEKDQVVFSDIDSIYKLVPSKNSDLCYNALVKHRESMSSFNWKYG